MRLDSAEVPPHTSLYGPYLQTLKVDVWLEKVKSERQRARAALERGERMKKVGYAGQKIEKKVAEILDMDSLL